MEYFEEGYVALVKFMDEWFPPLEGGEGDRGMAGSSDASDVADPSPMQFLGAFFGMVPSPFPHFHPTSPQPWPGPPTSICIYTPTHPRHARPCHARPRHPMSDAPAALS